MHEEICLFAPISRSNCATKTFKSTNQVCYADYEKIEIVASVARSKVGERSVAFANGAFRLKFGRFSSNKHKA